MVEPTQPEKVEQLARSLAMSGALGERDRLRAVELLRLLIRYLKGLAN